VESRSAVNDKESWLVPAARGAAAVVGGFLLPGLVTVACAFTGSPNDRKIRRANNHPDKEAGARNSNSAEKTRSRQADPDSSPLR
jgi:hypothetical protein